MTTAHPSNYTRGRTQRIEFLVLHYTAGRNDSAAGNLNYFRSPRGASAHYFVDRNGWLQSVDDGLGGRHGWRLPAEASALPQRQLDLHRDVLPV